MYQRSYENFPNASVCGSELRKALWLLDDLQSIILGCIGADMSQTPSLQNLRVQILAPIHLNDIILYEWPTR